MNMTTANNVILIPARMSSNRLPGKPMMHADGIPLVHHTWDRSGGSLLADKRWVVTPDPEILQYCDKQEIPVIRTSAFSFNGSHRCAEAYEWLQKQGISINLVINWQCDEPLVNPQWVDALITQLTKYRTQSVGTLVAPSSEGVRVVVSRGYCKWFSRAPMLGSMAHCGVYGFPAYTMKNIQRIHPTDLSLAEGLEQLAWLEDGIQIQAVTMDSLPLSINTPQDWAMFKELTEKHQQ